MATKTPAEIWDGLNPGEADEIVAIGADRIALSLTLAVERLLDMRLLKEERWPGGRVYMTTPLGRAVAEYGRKAGA